MCVNWLSAVNHRILFTTSTTATISNVSPQTIMNMQVTDKIMSDLPDKGFNSDIRKIQIPTTQTLLHTVQYGH